VPEVLAVVPLEYPTSAPELAALPRLVVQLVMSVLTAGKILISVPVVGADLDVIVVEV
jgi:hypothetical protein